MGGLSHTFRHISTKTQLRAGFDPAPAQSRNFLILGLTTAPNPIFSNLFQAFLNPFPIISCTPRVGGVGSKKNFGGVGSNPGGGGVLGLNGLGGMCLKVCDRPPLFSLLIGKKEIIFEIPNF